MEPISNKNPEVVNYGNARYEQGYAVGYERANTDRRIRIHGRRKLQFKRFNKLLHYINVLKD